MPKSRSIRKIIKSKPTVEGAGVHLKRAFGFGEVPQFDPFLLLDDFRGDDPKLYIMGFPWHPHRGIETITYMIDGYAEHGDSLGNKGVIGPGDVQWMTAGSGIIHQEMPNGDEKGRMGGFQLWANLPASHKMMNPRYRDVTGDTIPEVRLDNGVKIKIVCGEVDGILGPVQDVVVEPEYLDITIPAKTVYAHATKPGHTVFAYVIGGRGLFATEKQACENENLILFDDGSEALIMTENDPVRFLLISGKPIREPIAWRGPIVMNTQEELRVAFEEFHNGTFIKEDQD
jgi:redox-sensitive bicupin YhaK (pirin superfamily)